MKNKQHLKNYFSIGLLILLMVVIYPQRRGLQNSVNELKNAEIAFLFLAFLAQIVNYTSATLVYVSLSKRRLRFWRTLLVQGACGFTNRLLPAGLGALGLNAVYLVKNKYSVAQASTMVLLNNVLGVVGNTLLLLILVLVDPIHINLGITEKTFEDSLYLLAATVIVIAIIFYIPSFRNKIKKIVRDIALITSHYSKHPSRLLSALLFSMLITLCHCAVLSFVSKSVGSDVSLTGALLAISGGNIVGAVTPTPGGLVGVEAGIAASLVAQDLSSTTALAITLLYRFFTYWLPIVPGFIAFKTAQYKKYI